MGISYSYDQQTWIPVLGYYGFLLIAKNSKRQKVLTRLSISRHQPGIPVLA
jgi:hypothetical protein